MIRLLLLLSAILLAGCFPIIHSYYRAEPEHSSRYRDYCHGSAGPPTVAMFPFHKVFLAVALNRDLSIISYSISVPEGVVAQLISRSIGLSYASESATPSSTSNLAPVRASAGTAWQLKAIPTSFEQESYFGPLNGGSDAVEHWFKEDTIVHKTYHYEASFPARAAKEGYIFLPSLLVNDHRYEGPVVPFSKAHAFEVSPINC